MLEAVGLGVNGRLALFRRQGIGDDWRGGEWARAQVAGLTLTAGAGVTDSADGRRRGCVPQMLFQKESGAQYERASSNSAKTNFGLMTVSRPGIINKKSRTGNARPGFSFKAGSIFPRKIKWKNAGLHIARAFAGAFDVLRDGGVIIHHVIVPIGRGEVDAQGRFLDAVGHLAKTPLQAAVSVIFQLIAIAISEVEINAGQVRFAAGTGGVILLVAADEMQRVYVQIPIGIIGCGN